MDIEENSDTEKADDKPKLQNTTTGNEKSGSRLPEFAITASILAISLVIALGFYIKSVANSEPPISSEADEIASARLLITVLFILSTVVIALLLVLASVFINDERIRERLSLGKEVLTTFLVTVGTIVGFYFGTSTNADVANAIKEAKAPDAQAESAVTFASPRVFIQVFDDAGLEYATKLNAELEKISIQIMPIENVGDETGQKIQRFSENTVRYFYAEDKPAAYKVGKTIGSNTKVESFENETIAKTVKQGTIEVWLLSPQKET
ncbi:MAG: hypothetical protein ACK5NT_04040 [Pyrinomonadaceae bacterium]